MDQEQENLKKEYSMRFSSMEEYRESVWKVLVGGYFQKRIGEGKAILDLGSGWGEFINNVRGKERYAMDLNPDAKERVDGEVHFLEQDCSARWELADASLDVVFTSNFFEHLPTKASLLDTLKQAHRCLRPGGRIICLGPNIRYVGGAYWDFFDHYLELTETSLSEGLRMADFEIEEAIPRFLPYTMADGKNPPLAMVRLYLQMPFIWRFFGKQFLVTGRKS